MPRLRVLSLGRAAARKMVMAMEWMKKESANVPKIETLGRARLGADKASAETPLVMAEARMKASIKKTHPTPSTLKRARMRMDGRLHKGRSNTSTTAAAKPLGLGESDSHAPSRPSPPATGSRRGGVGGGR